MPIATMKCARCPHPRRYRIDGLESLTRRVRAFFDQPLRIIWIMAG
jgi:hypothetical protein